MKKISQILFVIGSIALVGLIIVIVTTLAKQALGNEKQSRTKVECSQPGTEYLVTIQNGQPTITDIQAKTCDQLTIMNSDDQLRLIAFGVHEDHETYNGITEQTLEKNDKFTVTLNETGRYTFHDHLNDTFLGTFTVE